MPFGKMQDLTPDPFSRPLLTPDPLPIPFQFMFVFKKWKTDRESTVAVKAVNGEKKNNLGHDVAVTYSTLAETGVKSPQKQYSSQSS